MNAQISTYWSESFSTKSALLSGAVVGGYQDESSIYYNPAILSDSNINRYSFANGLASISAIRYENALGEGLDAGNWESSVDPGFLSVNLYPKKKLGLVWKAAFFNKTKFDNGFSSEFRETYDVLLEIEGLENYLGRVTTRTEYSDYWYGAGIAKFINEDLSFGVSVFGRYASLRYGYNKTVEVSGSDAQSAMEKVALNQNSIDLHGYSWRGTVKLGLNYRISDGLRLGLVVTAPSFTVMSSSDANRVVAKLNVPNKETGDLLPDFLYDESAENMKLIIRDPLSIAVGVDYNHKRNRWNLTAEWFAGLKPYLMVDQTEGETYTTISPIITPNPHNLSFAGGGNSIANIAIGMERYLANNKSWLFGFKTDFDALRNFDYEDLSGLNTLANAKSHYFHFSAGKNFEFLNFDVLFGLQYSMSRESGLTGFANFKPPIIFDSKDPYILEGSPQNNMNFKGDALTVFVGLTLKNKNEK